MLRLHSQVTTNDSLLPQISPASRRTLTAMGRCRIQALHVLAVSAVMLGRPMHSKATLPVLKSEFREYF
jgi:hypothetical protein